MNQFRNSFLLSTAEKSSQNYLHQIYDVVDRALEHHVQVFVIPLQLKYPYNNIRPEDELTAAHMQRFIDRLKVNIRSQMSREGSFAEKIEAVEIRYAWAECSCREGRPKYHCLLLINADTFNALGYFERGISYLRSRFVSAWASALGRSSEYCAGLVYVSKTHLRRLDNDQHNSGVQDIVKNCEFLSRMAAKRHVPWIKSFGCSRM